jgi:hypothetical protein
MALARAMASEASMVVYLFWTTIDQTSTTTDRQEHEDIIE